MARIWKFGIHWSPPDEISREGTWVIFYECWMYADGSLIKTIWQAITNWKDDRHLVG